MKRFKEKADAAVAYADESTSEHKGLVFLDFLAGADWADGTMIDKACEWLEQQVYQEYGGGPLERLVPDERIADFRKAMED